MIPKRFIVSKDFDERYQRYHVGFGSWIAEKGEVYLCKPRSEHSGWVHFYASSKKTPIAEVFSCHKNYIKEVIEKLVRDEYIIILDEGV
jgi:hypothetical protein